MNYIPEKLKIVSIFYEDMKNKIFELFFQMHVKFLIKDASQNGYKYFLKPNDIKDWGTQYYKYFSDLWLKMNRFEATNDMVYERESLKHYAGFEYININKFLRGEYVPYSDLCLERISSITTCLNKFSLNDYSL